MAKKATKNVPALKASEEFVVGKHSIGWVDSDFRNAFYEKSFSPSTLGKFQKLGKYMANADEIERELKPGKCSLGDVLAFLQNPPEGCKDGWANLFLIGDRVVSVRWGSDDGGWGVDAWCRDGVWSGGGRVFSPGLDSQSLDSSESLTLERAIELVKKEGYLVYKQM